MTGNVILERALSLLGYINSQDIRVGNENLLKVAPRIISYVCYDLKISPIERLDVKIDEKPEILDALCYGTAMLLSLETGDIAMNKFFANVYNGKRALALSSKDIVQDKLPTVSYGVD